MELLQGRQIADLRHSQYLIAVLLEQLGRKSVNSRVQAEEPVARAANRNEESELGQSRLHANFSNVADNVNNYYPNELPEQR